MGIRRLLLAVLTLVLFGGLAATASAETDMTGSWFNNEYDYPVGSPGTNVGGSGTTDNITLQDLDGNFSGKTYGDAGYPILGKVTNGSVRFSKALSGGGSSTNQIFQGTLSDSNQVVTGYSATCTIGSAAFPSHAIYIGTFVISLPTATHPLPIPTGYPSNPTAAQALCADPLPTGPDFRHVTSTTTQCYRGQATTDNATCQATVTDTGSPAETPSGTVTFTVAAGQGSLPAGSSCTLAASGASGSPGTCQITYAPPAGGLAQTATVPIQASYIGDSDHKPSSAASGASVFTPAPPPATTPPVAITPPGSAVAATVAQCQDFAIVPANLNLSPTDYQGPDSAYGAKAQNVLSCSLIASASVALGGKWVTDSLAAALQQANAGTRFAQTFQTYIDTGNGWMAVAAQIHPWAASQSTAYTTALHDPPAPSYTTLAKAKSPKVPLVRVAGSKKDRAAATAMNTWLKALATSRGLADAFTTTVNRAGGAKAAGRTTWQGKQIRLAITLAKQLAAQDTKLVTLTKSLAKLAATSPKAKKGLSAKELKAIRAKVAKSGLSASQRKALKKLGYDAAAITALVASAKNTSVPTAKLLTTPASMLADPQFVTELQSFALYFTLWVARPEVVTAAAL